MPVRGDRHKRPGRSTLRPVRTSAIAAFRLAQRPPAQVPARLVAHAERHQRAAVGEIDADPVPADGPARQHVLGPLVVEPRDAAYRLALRRHERAAAPRVAAGCSNSSPTRGAGPLRLSRPPCSSGGWWPRKSRSSGNRAPDCARGNAPSSWQRPVVDPTQHASWSAPASSKPSRAARCAWCRLPWAGSAMPRARSMIWRGANALGLSLLEFGRTRKK